MCLAHVRERTILVSLWYSEPRFAYSVVQSWGWWWGEGHLDRALHSALPQRTALQVSQMSLGLSQPFESQVKLPRQGVFNLKASDSAKSSLGCLRVPGGPVVSRFFLLSESCSCQSSASFCWRQKTKPHFWFPWGKKLSATKPKSLSHEKHTWAQ